MHGCVAIGVLWQRTASCAAVLLTLFAAAASANSDCRCVPELVLPGGNLANLRDVAVGGKASRVSKSVTVRLRAVDVSPGSCTAGESSDPVAVSLALEDDDGDVILDRAAPGFVCTSDEKTNAKFVAIFEGPKNCKNSAVPDHQSNGAILGSVSTDDGGALLFSRKIRCAEAVPVEFSFDPPPNYHVTQGDTLNFSVTAGRRDRPVSVSASGLPASASFDGTNVSWVGGFGEREDGNYDVTFAADGETALINIATTQYPISNMDLTDLSGAVIQNSLPVPVGGQARVIAKPRYVNPLGVPNIGGQGANAWNDFVWSIDANYIADFRTATNVAVIEGAGGGTTKIRATFTDAALGVVTASATLESLEVISIAISPADFTLPEGSTEPLRATATLMGGIQTANLAFGWLSSNESIADVVPGSVLGVANVTGHSLGTATITAFNTNGPVVRGTTNVTSVPARRSQDLFAMDRQPAGSRIVSIDTAGNTQFHAAMSAPYNDQFCSSSSHTTNELMVGGFEASTGFSEIQRIDALGNVTDVFTSTTVTPLGDTIDLGAVRYRPDGGAYFAMSEGQHTLTFADALGRLTRIEGPNGNDGFGPIAIAPFGNDRVYSGPWGVELLGQGNRVEGFADLVARYDASAQSNQFVARMGVSQPRLAAPGGDLWILDGGTGQLFRFEDLNRDGDYYEIKTTSSGEEAVKNAVDDPGERILAGQLPSGFDELHLNPTTGNVIAVRIVGTVPQHISVMILEDLNGDGDVDDAGEQAVVFDAGAPPGTDAADVLMKY